MLDGVNMEREALLSASFLTELELSDTPLLLGSTGKMAVMDMLLGAGGAALGHLLIALAVVLLPFMPPPPGLQESFLTVNLVEMEASSGASSDTGSGEGAAGWVPKEPPAPEATQPEKIPAPVPLQAVNQAERVRPATEKAEKKVAPATPKPARDLLIPVTAPEQPSAPASVSSCDTAAAAAGKEEGKEQSAKGVGAEAGWSLASGSATGAGLHGGEFNADAVDKIPQALHKVEPLYPQRARKQGVCGKVVLKFLVAPDGHVSRPSILEASPAGYFEQSALEAIRHWRFQPGLYQGRAVATWVVLPVQFQLTS